MADPQYINIGSPETKMIEECSELIKVLCKCDRFGYGNFNQKDGKYNLTRVIEEIADVKLAIKNLEEKIENMINIT